MILVLSPLPSFLPVSQHSETVQRPSRKMHRQLTRMRSGRSSTWRQELAIVDKCCFTLIHMRRGPFLGLHLLRLLLKSIGRSDIELQGRGVDEVEGGTEIVSVTYRT